MALRETEANTDHRQTTIVDSVAVDPKASLAATIQQHQENTSDPEREKLERQLKAAQEQLDLLLDKAGADIAGTFGVQYTGLNASNQMVFQVEAEGGISRGQTQGMTDFMQEKGLAAERHDGIRPGTILIDSESFMKNPDLRKQLEAHKEEIQLEATQVLANSKDRVVEAQRGLGSVGAATVEASPAIMGTETNDKLHASAGNDQLAPPAQPTQVEGKTFVVSEDGLTRTEVTPGQGQATSTAPVTAGAAPVTSVEYAPRTDFSNVSEDERALVTRAQQQLIALGGDLNPERKFKMGGADGLIGEVTTAEVIKFKQEHGIEPLNGNITEDLVKKMEVAVADKNRPVEKEQTASVTPAAPEPKTLAMSPESASKEAPAYGLSAATQEALKEDREKPTVVATHPAFGLSPETLAAVKAAVASSSEHVSQAAQQGVGAAEGNMSLQSVPNNKVPQAGVGSPDFA